MNKSIICHKKQYENDRSSYHNSVLNPALIDCCLTLPDAEISEVCCAGFICLFKLRKQAFHS